MYSKLEPLSFSLSFPFGDFLATPGSIIHVTPQTQVRMAACNPKSQAQRWELSPSGQLKHTASTLCLDLGEGSPGQEVTLAPCREGGRGQVLYLKSCLF